MALQISTKNWWETDSYTADEPIPESFREFAGPHGIALVDAYANGATQKGWGLNPPASGGEGSSNGTRERSSRRSEHSSDTRRRASRSRSSCEVFDSCA